MAGNAAVGNIGIINKDGSYINDKSVREFIKKNHNVVGEPIIINIVEQTKKEYESFWK
nr:hypothetical protein [Francisella tularensis]